MDPRRKGREENKEKPPEKYSIEWCATPHEYIIYIIHVCNAARRCLEPPAILTLPAAIYRYMLEAERRRNLTDMAVAADAQPAPVMPAAVGAGAALVGTCALLLARAVSDVPPS